MNFAGLLFRFPLLRRISRLLCKPRPRFVAFSRGLLEAKRRSNGPRRTRLYFSNRALSKQQRRFAYRVSTNTRTRVRCNALLRHLELKAATVVSLLIPAMHRTGLSLNSCGHVKMLWLFHVGKEC